MLQPVRRVLGIISETYSYMFLFGIAGGVGFELFKIHFSMGGVNYYSVFKRNQLRNQLGKLEKQLRQNERVLLDSMDVTDQKT
jgi:hypothetical protein